MHHHIGRDMAVHAWPDDPDCLGCEAERIDMDRAEYFGYFHTCGGVAFYYESPGLYDGDLVTSRKAITIEGERPDPDSPIICGSCGDKIKKTTDLQLTKSQQVKS